MVDYLSCPACGNPLTGGQLCNLTCVRTMHQRAVIAKEAEAQKAARFMDELEAVRFNLRPQA